MSFRGYHICVYYSDAVNNMCEADMLGFLEKCPNHEMDGSKLLLTDITSLTSEKVARWFSKLYIWIWTDHILLKIMFKNVSRQST